MSKKIVFFFAKKSNISKLLCTFAAYFNAKRKCSEKTFVYLRQPSRTLFVLCLSILCEN